MNHCCCPQIVIGCPCSSQPCISPDPGNILTADSNGCLYVPRPPAQPALDPSPCNAAKVTTDGLLVPRVDLAGIAPRGNVSTQRSVDIDVAETPGCPDTWTIGARLTPVSGMTVAQAPFVDIPPSTDGSFSYAAIPALRVTLPEAGIYDLDLNIRYELISHGESSAFMGALLTNATTGADIPGSITMLSHINSAGPEFSHSTVPINVRHQIAGPSEIEVRGYLSWLRPVTTARLGGSDSNGASRFRWTKISD